MHLFLGEKFIAKIIVALILGDNFFHGQSLVEIIKRSIKKLNLVLIFFLIM